MSAKRRTRPGKGPSRRGFLARAGAGWAVFCTASGAALAMTARFFFPNDGPGGSDRFKVGFPEEYPASAEGAVSERFKERGVWIVRNLDGIYALSTECTHLGCTPIWVPAERKFKCPCHGSGFRVSGVNFEGPAPRPLERFMIALADDGQIEVDLSRTFQQELGQWDDPEAFLKYRAGT